MERVYPRAGGGTKYLDIYLGSGEGLSPRRRGNPREKRLVRLRPGSIPAQAGEPSPGWKSRSTCRVYPRASGGTITLATLRGSKPGLSPRKRGNRRLAMRRVLFTGSIPAQAGEPYFRKFETYLGRVYPRASGGTRFVLAAVGSGAGLSPRKRGNLRHRRGHVAEDGSIPAQAGEPWTSRISSGWTRVYPRASGGTRDGGSGVEGKGGLSPRKRGNHGVLFSGNPYRGSIPAQAGEPKAVLVAKCIFGVYPRASGGTT